MRFFKKNCIETEQTNRPLCALLDLKAAVRTFFDVEYDYDPKFKVLYFTMYDIKDKKKKRSSEIIVNYTERVPEIESLVEFLNDWDFDSEKLPKFFLSCDCGADLFKFYKLKKDAFGDDEDNMYIDYFCTGRGRFRRKQTIEVNITRQQAELLASRLTEFLERHAN